jgi:hypothetical protein
MRPAPDFRVFFSTDNHQHLEMGAPDYSHFTLSRPCPIRLKCTAEIKKLKAFGDICLVCDVYPQLVAGPIERPQNSSISFMKTPGEI